MSLNCPKNTKNRKYCGYYLHNQKKGSTFAVANLKHRGVEQLVARQAHNLEVACSSPASATKQAVTSWKVNELRFFMLVYKRFFAQIA